jgi:hypothetical protein
MKIDMANKLKVKEFLRVNLETLKGEQLAEFMEKYDVREAGTIEMMMIDHGMPGKFLAFKQEDEPGMYFVTSIEMVEKILFLEPESLKPDS